MDPSLAKSFVERDRAQVQALRKEHWARLAQASNGQATLQVGWALFARAREIDPQFPRVESRDRDLAHHIRLKNLVDRAASRFVDR